MDLQSFIQQFLGFFHTNLVQKCIEILSSMILEQLTQVTAVIVKHFCQYFELEIFARVTLDKFNHLFQYSILASPTHTLNKSIQMFRCHDFEIRHRKLMIDFINQNRMFLHNGVHMLIRRCKLVERQGKYL
ncbi:hypothetical protein D3C76_1137620 [compost metagenome]